MINEKKIFIITAERYSPWYERNLLKVAIELSKIGIETFYLNVSDDFDGKSKDQAFREATNMDGDKYGFLMALSDTAGAELFLERVYEHRDEYTVVCDCRLAFLKKEIDADIVFDSLRARQRNAFIYKKIMKRTPFTAIRGMRFGDGLKNAKIIDLEDPRQKKLISMGSSDEDILMERREYYEDILKRITN